MPGHDENAPQESCRAGQLGRRQPGAAPAHADFALTVSALTLAAMWAGYSWAQAHREGLLFRTEDVALALVSAAVLFAAGAALGGAARPVRRRYPRLAAYVTLLVSVLGLGATAVEEATDTQVLGSAPVVDVLGLACAVLLAALFWVRLTKARPTGTPCGGWTRGPWPAWLAGIAIVVPVMLVGGTAGLAAHQATIVNDTLKPFADGELSPGDGRPTFTPAQDALEHRYPEVAAAVNHSAVDMVTIAAQLQSRAGTERSPDDWTVSFTFWAVHQRCLEAKARVWLPCCTVRCLGTATRSAGLLTATRQRRSTETSSGTPTGAAPARRRLGGRAHLLAPPDASGRLACRGSAARIEARAAKAVTDETCDAATKGRD